MSAAELMQKAERSLKTGGFGRASHPRRKSRPAGAHFPGAGSAVEALPGYRLKNRFLDGTEGFVDMSARVHRPALACSACSLIQAVSQKSSLTMALSLGRVRSTWHQMPCTELSVKPGSGCCRKLPRLNCLEPLELALTAPWWGRAVNACGLPEQRGFVFRLFL